MKKRIVQWTLILVVILCLVGIVGLFIPANPSQAWMSYYTHPEAADYSEFVWGYDNITIGWYGPFYINLCEEKQIGNGLSVSWWGRWLRVL